MKSRTPWMLFGKILLLVLPFALFAAFTISHTPYETDTQQSLISDKIQKLVLDATPPPQVIIAGDSRAEQNVIPDAFAAASGLSATNVGVGDGLMPQAYDILNSEGALNHKRLILMSVSIYDINDALKYDQQLDKVIIDAEPFSIQKITDLYNYYDAFINYYFYNFKAVMRFAKFDYAHMSPSLYATKGFLGGDDVLALPKDGSPFPLDILGWYKDLRLGGLRQQDLIRAIQGLGATNDTVVIYEGPGAPAWKAAAKGTKVEAAEDQFAKVLTAAVAPYPNIHFIDFEATDTSDVLPNSEFGDFVHLNKNGAAVFTKLLVNTLKQQKIIK